MQKTILNPGACRSMVPALEQSRNPDVWVYRYAHPAGWRLSIATHAPPGSNKLSLGGFRIAPEERTSVPGFDSDIEAIELALGMEEKVFWSRLVGVGGPLALRDMSMIVGGKCVLHPTPDARVGMPRDRELLDFAVRCLADCERTSGIRITTGQDLGHGILSDGTPSLKYLHAGFAGSVVADTSKPTGEGNYHALLGMLRAFGVPVAQSKVGLVGAGNIGTHIIERLRQAHASISVLERQADRRAALQREGIDVHAPDAKMEYLRQPMDALVLNAAGGSLDTLSVQTSSANERLKAVCGSENLVMPHPADAALFQARRKVYCPTEFAGMMGYLTALEQYLVESEGGSLDVDSMLAAARGLEEPTYAATRHVIDSGFRVGFEQAVEAVCGQGSTRS